jgi:hypothetical protein
MGLLMNNIPNIHVFEERLTSDFHDLIQLQFAMRKLEPPTVNDRIAEAFRYIGKIYTDQSQRFNALFQQLPPPIQRSITIIGSLSQGAFMGFVGYLSVLGINRLIPKITNVAMIQGPINLIPFVLLGVAINAVVETALLTHDIARLILGERKVYENQDCPETTSRLGQLRQHVWKVIGRFEKLQEDIDTIFSNLFKIRTAKQLKAENIPDRDLQFLEIFRRAFGEQVKESIINFVPPELGIYAVEALGFTVIGAHLFVSLYPLIFLFGLVNKVVQVWEKVEFEATQEQKRHEQEQKRHEQEVLEEQHQHERETKMYCDILAAMYPAEFAELDAREQAEANKVQEEKDKAAENGEHVKAVNQLIAEFVIIDKSHFKFDPSEHADKLAYRPTVFQSYKTNGLPVRNHDENSLILEDEPLDISQLDQGLVDHLIIVELELEIQQKTIT